MIRALKDTKIPQMVSTGLYTEKALDVAVDMVDKMLDVLVSSVTDILNDIKNVNTPVAFVFRKPNNDFIAAAMVQFFPNEDKSKPGNWNYSWTFEEEDVPEDAQTKTMYDFSLISYFTGTAISKYGFYADHTEYYGDTFIFLLQTIKLWLDENAAENEENGVSLDGVIQFRVAIENGEKVFSAEPDSEIKIKIKNDAAIEV